MQNNWPSPKKKLGDVSAVAFDLANNVLVFHRGDRIWNQLTFNMANVYEGANNPIIEPTIVAFDRTTGAVSYELGENMFYMPHGITVDQEGCIWLTDVALHQVFKLKRTPLGVSKQLELGVAFRPGSSQQKFCKPTSVAVLPDGDFFVADGYCNARIIKYSKAGERLLTWGRNAFQGHAYETAPENFFAVPHALVLAADLGLLCVADRENGRVQCFYIKDGTFHSQYHSEIVGDRLFSVAYAPIQGGRLYVVNGPSVGIETPEHYVEVLGFVIDMKTGKVLSKFGPKGGQFQNPHDIIITPDGAEVSFFL